MMHAKLLLPLHLSEALSQFIESFEWSVAFQLDGISTYLLGYSDLFASADAHNSRAMRVLFPQNQQSSCELASDWQVWCG